MHRMDKGSVKAWLHSHFQEALFEGARFGRPKYGAPQASWYYNYTWADTRSSRQKARNPIHVIILLLKVRFITIFKSPHDFVTVVSFIKDVSIPTTENLIAVSALIDGLFVVIESAQNRRAVLADVQVPFFHGRNHVVPVASLFDRAIIGKGTCWRSENGEDEINGEDDSDDSVQR